MKQGRGLTFSIAFIIGVILVVVNQLSPTVKCDIYLHNPAGSNNRNCEKNEDRQNANLLFNSQNNARGGYACRYPENEKLYFHSGSIVPVEWTAQHGCGNGRTQCDLVIQLMCANNVRDGAPKGPNNGDGTKTIPEEEKAVDEKNYAMHEDFEYYKQCKDRQRNKGLFTADRNVKNDRGATATRQNENGDRYGFECPEESNYYPYWHPSPWMDVAIFTNNASRCSYYRQESQNVKAKYYCRARVSGLSYTNQVLGLKGVTPKEEKKKAATEKGNFPNNQKDCEEAGHEWVSAPSWGVAAPACALSQFNRENHLGNVDDRGHTSHYYWRVPEVQEEKKCVLRVRYNISSGEANQHPPEKYLDYTYNGDKSPFKTSPIVTYLDGVHLAVKQNTNQFGRTFQDRSYVFRIVPANAEAVKSQGQVYNLNVRGKRGNIVQTFPAVEYDFVPNRLTINQNDFIHFQWVGSDYNPARNPNNGEGGPTENSDRHNLVEKETADCNTPFTDQQKLKEKTMFVKSDGSADIELMKKLAFLEQKDCQTLDQLKQGKGNDAKEREKNYCAKINIASPYFDGGVVQLRKVGSFNYMSSRNNNFSNRDQKGLIIVKEKIHTNKTT